MASMFSILLNLTCLFVFAAPSTDLTLKVLGKESKWTQEQLIQHPKVQRVKLAVDPNNSGQESFYDAISMIDLLESAGATGGKSIHLIAKDGMAVVFKKERLLNPLGAKAFLAVAPFGQKWPVKKGQLIGPYYLFWLNPKTSKIGSEEWPYMVHRIEVHSGLVEKDFPLVAPNPKLDKDHPAYQGFQVFQKNCFACHTMNKQGPSSMGPDLNFPRSPVEYMKTEVFKKYIRNPKTLRHWPKSKMPAFDESELSETEMWQLLRYFTHMVSLRTSKTQ